MGSGDWKSGHGLQTDEIRGCDNTGCGELKLNSAKQGYGPRVAKPDFSRKTAHLDFYVKSLNL